jgi:hypothetical protein
VQAAALLPNKLRPFVPVRPRAYTTQLQRQQAANKLLGPYLLLLLQELQTPPQHQQKVHNAKPSHCPFFLCIMGPAAICCHIFVLRLMICISNASCYWVASGNFNSCLAAPCMKFSTCCEPLAVQASEAHVERSNTAGCATAAQLPEGGFHSCSVPWSGLQLLMECMPLAKAAGAACLAQEEELYKAETNAQVSLKGWYVPWVSNKSRYSCSGHTGMYFRMCLPACPSPAGSAVWLSCGGC